MFAWRRLAVHRRVVVTTKTGKSFAGVLFSKRGPLLVLKEATLFNPGSPPAPVDGDVLLERANVDFVQVLPVVEG